MKKLINLLLLFLIIPVVFAPCPGDPYCPDYSSDDIDYGSHDDVNRLEPQDLASAIEQGKVSDMSIVDDNKLADALISNPSISTKLEGSDLARAVNQRLSLLENPSIMNEIDSRAQSDTFILNNNPNIKKKWFASREITDEGTELESYDGSIVKTKGSQATTFNMKYYPGARVTKYGKLILADGVEIASAEVTKAEDGSININGGYTDLSNSQNVNIHVNKGTAQVGNMIYTSAEDKPVDIFIKDGKTIITGTNIVEADRETGKTTATFSGEVATFTDGYKIFAKGTEYTPYLEGKKSKTYTVDELTEYHITVSCDGLRNCIQDVDGSVRVVSKKGNVIEIKTFDNSIKDLKVDEIKDGSFVFFNDHGKVEMTFTKNPVTVKGDPSALTPDSITTTFRNADDKERNYLLIGGKSMISEHPIGSSLPKKDIFYERITLTTGKSSDLRYPEVRQNSKNLEPKGSGIYVSTTHVDESNYLHTNSIRVLDHYGETFMKTEIHEVNTVLIPGDTIIVLEPKWSKSGDGPPRDENDDLASALAMASEYEGVYVTSEIERMTEKIRNSDSTLDYYLNKGHLSSCHQSGSYIYSYEVMEKPEIVEKSRSDNYDIVDRFTKDGIKVIGLSSAKSYGKNNNEQLDDLYVKVTFGKLPSTPPTQIIDQE